MPWETDPVVSDTPAPAAKQPSAKQEAPTQPGGWQADPVVDEPSKLSSVVSKYGHALEVGLTDDAALADMMLNLPAAGIAIANQMGRYAQGIVTGERHDVTSKAARQVRDQTEALFGNPVAKLMHLAGYKQGYDQSHVQSVLGKISGVLAKGGKWVEEKTGGLLNADDVDALTNEAMTLAGARATGAGLNRVATRMLEPKPKDVPKVHLDSNAENPDAPAKPTPTTTPPQLAKQHIEQSVGIKDEAARAKFNKQRRADAKAAFAEDPGYADYLRNYADEEARQRSVAGEQAALKEKGTVLDTAVLKKPPPDVSWNEALTSMKKPGFQRTADDLVKLRRFQQQGGRISPDMLIRMAAIGIFGAALYNIDPDHPLVDTALAFGGGMAVAHPKLTAARIAQAFKADDRIRASDHIDKWEGAFKSGARSVWQHSQRVMAFAPTVERRNALTHWMQGDKSIPITNKELVAAEHGRAFFEEMGKEAMAQGVLHNMIPDYVTNLWDLTGKNRETWNKITANMSPKSRFDMERKITSLAVGKKLGLVPVTEDLAQIMTTYGNSMVRAMANKQLLESLKNELVDTNTTNTIVMDAKDAPQHYVKIDHPQLMGKAVHPDVATELGHVFETSHPLAIMKGAEALTFAIKRMNVGLSMFHATSLIMAAVGAGLNPLKVVSMLRGTDEFLHQLRTGGVGDVPDRFLKAGGNITLEHQQVGVEDFGGAGHTDPFLSSMESMGEWADKVVPHAGAPFRGFENLTKSIDHMMWARLHPGLKLRLFAKEANRIAKNNRDHHLADPRVPLRSQLESDKIAASYVNDIFGGINWRRVANEARTAWGRDLKLQAFTRSGRRALQVLMFAPDWTMSVTRAFVKQFTAKSTYKRSIGQGLKGLIKPEEMADLHRRYYIRNAIFYMTAANGLNYALSGHFMWDNSKFHKYIDWTDIDLGDGRYIPFNKHAMEPFHMMMHPLQTAAYKLGYLPSETIMQLSGKQYINTEGKAPPMDTSVPGRVEHALKRATPFWAQAPDLSPESLEGAAMGMGGFPIRGVSDARREELKKEKKLERKLNPKRKKKGYFKEADE